MSGKDAVALAREIAEHAITLVRNDDQLLPMNSLKPDAHIFNLAITNGDDRLWVANAFGSAPVECAWARSQNRDGCARRSFK